MVYVQRDNGVIVGCFAKRQPGIAEEFVADNSPEVLAFRNPPPPTADEIEAQVQAALNGGNARHLDPFKLLKAMFVSNLAHRLGKAPGALTGAELTAERNRIAAIYKAL